MRWLSSLSDNVKRGIRSWLNIQPAGVRGIQINGEMETSWNSSTSRARSTRTGINFGRPGARRGWKCERFTRGCRL